MWTAEGAIGSATHLMVTAPYAGDTNTALGGLLVGEPREVRWPTSLVKLNSSLPIA